MSNNVHILVRLNSIFGVPKLSGSRKQEGDASSIVFLITRAISRMTTRLTIQNCANFHSEVVERNSVLLGPLSNYSFEFTPEVKSDQSMLRLKVDRLESFCNTIPVDTPVQKSKLVVDDDAVVLLCDLKGEGYSSVPAAACCLERLSTLEGVHQQMRPFEMDHCSYILRQNIKLRGQWELTTPRRNLAVERLTRNEDFIILKRQITEIQVLCKYLLDLVRLFPIHRHPGECRSCTDEFANCIQSIFRSLRHPRTGNRANRDCYNCCFDCLLLATKMWYSTSVLQQCLALQICNVVFPNWAVSKQVWQSVEEVLNSMLYGDPAESPNGPEVAISRSQSVVRPLYDLHDGPAVDLRGLAYGFASVLLDYTNSPQPIQRQTIRFYRSERIILVSPYRREQALQQPAVYMPLAVPGFELRTSEMGDDRVTTRSSTCIRCPELSFLLFRMEVTFTRDCPSDEWSDQNDVTGLPDYHGKTHHSDHSSRVLHRSSST
ncbi:hypothetical protein CLF_105823 [Clonorchis sinensis]|uniref:Uncharacterized protein n=1 Tax=Clonorchis sinensis TaxID=79923 RepID=G7YE97_CLOSI|nr:hypothetical protein CLF_105823 [Clonorchis sinensis]